MKRVLITGANGLIGRHVLPLLLADGWEVHAAALPATPCYNDGVSWHGVDLLDAATAKRICNDIRPTHLLHLAWYTEHGLYWHARINLDWVTASVRLAEEFCKAGGQRMVMAGTCAEYDWSYGYCREETTPLNPATMYGIAKDAARRLIMAVADQHKLPCAWGRVFLPFGAGEAPERLIPSLIEVFKGTRPAFGVNGTAYRDFLHVTDVARAFAALLTTDGHGAYNICSGQPIQIGEVVKTVASLMQADPQPLLEMATERPGEPSLLAGDTTRIRQLGWRQEHTLEQGLRHTLAGMHAA